MSVIAHIVLISWFPFVLFSAGIAKGQRTVVALLIAGWLLLPNAGYKLIGLPDYDKFSATSLALAASLLLFAPERISRVRLRWWDVLPVLVVASQFASSVNNGLGAYDGASAALDAIICCLLPYFIGRIYLEDTEGLRLLAFGISSEASCIFHCAC